MYIYIYIYIYIDIDIICINCNYFLIKVLYNSINNNNILHKD